MKIVNPLHNLLLLFSGLFFMTAFFTLKKPLTIHFANTIYIVPFAKVFMISAVYLSLIWLLYTFTSKIIFSKKLYRVHIIGSIILFSLLLITALWSNQAIESYTQNDSLQKLKLSIETGQLMVIALLILTSIQLLYPLNLIIGLIKKKKTDYVITKSK